MNKRILEASALRVFFQEQWEYLQRLIEARQLNKLRQQHESEILSDAVETLVDGTDVRLRGIGSYQQDLRKSARGLLDYVEGLVALMPAAVQLSQVAYIHDPIVSVLFKNPAEIHRLFSQHRSVLEYFSNPLSNQGDEVFAVMFLNRTEKNILGAEMQGEIILKEVQQTSVSFTGHRLMAIEASEEGLRSAMKKILFDTAVQYLERQISKIRHAQTEEEKLVALQNPDRNIENPGVYLQMLVQLMSVPQKLIRLQDNLLRVNSMGIKLPLASGDSANGVRLHELTVGEEQSSILVLVRYPKSELPPNLEVDSLF